MSRLTSVVAVIAVSSLLSGCGSSFVASNGGRMRADDAAAERYGARSAPMLASMQLPQLSSDPQPAARFPVTLAIAPAGMGTRNYIRDVEEGIDLMSLRKLPGVADVIVLPTSTQQQDVYAVAQSAGADIVIIYDVSAARSHRGTSIPGLGVLTLGAFPNEYEKAYATATANFIDTHTGFVYATAETTSSSTEIQNAWQERDNTVHLKAQRAALRALMQESREAWRTVHARFATR